MRGKRSGRGTKGGGGTGEGRGGGKKEMEGRKGDEEEGEEGEEGKGRDVDDSPLLENVYTLQCFRARARDSTPPHYVLHIKFWLIPCSFIIWGVA